MDLAASLVKDVSILRRMLFATAYLPQEVPNYWEIIASFSFTGSKSKLTSDKVKLLMENLQIIDKEVFTTDLKLTKELLNVHEGSSLQPIGVVLISEKQSCHKCGGRLLLRRDRPSRVTLYTEHIGTVPASHYHKFCQNQRR